MTLLLCQTRVGPVDSPIWLKFCMHAWLGVPITKLIFLDCQCILRGKYGSWPFGAPLGHGNEAGQEQPSFAFSFLYLFYYKKICNFSSVF